MVRGDLARQRFRGSLSQDRLDATPFLAKLGQT
jgi:hypothetical protein